MTRSQQDCLWSAAWTLVAVVLTAIAPLPAADVPSTQPDARSATLSDLTVDLKLPDVKITPMAELPSQATDLLAEARGLIDQHRTVLATVKLEKALTYAPKSREVHRMLGQAHILGGNSAKAEIHLQRALDMGPDDREAWYWLGLAEEKLGRPDAAMDSMLMATRCKPAPADSAVALRLPYDLGRLLQDKGRSAAAMELLENVLAATDLKKMSEAQKADPVLFALAGEGRGTLAARVIRLKVTLGRDDEAMALLKTLPTDVQQGNSVRLAMVSAYLADNRKDKAGDVLGQIASAAKPEDAETLVKDATAAGLTAQSLADLGKAWLFGAGPATRQPTSADATLALMTAIAAEKANPGKGAGSDVLEPYLTQVPAAPAAVHVRLLDWLTAEKQWAQAAPRLAASLKAHAADADVLSAADRLFAAMPADQARELSGGAEAAAAKDDSFATRYVAGRMFEHAGQGDQALADLAAAVKDKPDFTPAWVARVRIQLEADQPDAALADFEKAGGIKSDDPTLLQVGGQTQLARGEADKAIDVLRRAEQLAPTRSDIAIDLAEAYLAGKQPTAALRRLRRAYEINPRDLGVLIRLAKLNLGMDQYEEAKLYASKAQQIDPKSVEAAALGGQAAVEEAVATRPGEPARIRQGLDALKAVVTKNPENPQAVLSQALSLSAVYEKAYSDDVDPATVVQLRGLVSSDDLVAALHKAIKLNPRLVDLHEKLGSACTQSGRLEEAIEQYRYVRERRPEDLDVLRRLTLLLATEHRIAEAAKVLMGADDGQLRELVQLVLTFARKAVQDDQPAPVLGVLDRSIGLEQDADTKMMISLHKALVLAAMKKDDEAVTLAASIYKEHPGNNSAVLYYVETLVRLSRYDDATKVLTQAAADAGSPEQAAMWWDRLAGVCLRADRPDEAAKAVESMYKADPERVGRCVDLLNMVGRYQRALELIDAAPANAQEDIDLQMSRFEALVGLKRHEDADKAMAKILDAAKAMAGRMNIEADAVLAEIHYQAANCYSRVQDRERSVKELEATLKVSPDHTGASNDLGYQLADDGKDLDRAEKLIHKALSAQPDTTAYMDSLGWVLYKRGQFKEASAMLARAVGSEPDPDGVILDHYGDSLYRLGERDKALEQWKKAEKDYRKHRSIPRGLDRSSLEGVLRKIEAAENGKSNVPVAPLGENVTPPGAERT